MSPEEAKRFLKNNPGPAGNPRERVPSDYTFEEAVGFVSEIAFRHEGDKPLLVGLYGTDGETLRLFVREIRTRVMGKDAARIVMDADGFSKDDVESLLYYKKKHPRFIFPMYILVDAEISPTTIDSNSAEVFGRFLDIIVGIQPPGREKSTAQEVKGAIMEQRRIWAQSKEIPFSEPEIFLVENP